MVRVLLVGQEKGGVGKSLVARGLAEAVPAAEVPTTEQAQPDAAADAAAGDKAAKGGKPAEKAAEKKEKK